MYITEACYPWSRVRTNSLPASKLTTPEVVEILFSRGLVKVLFATETFAMVGSNRTT